MSSIVLITAGAVVFFLRDALLLAKSTGRALVVYALGATAVFAVLGVGFETVSRAQAVEWLQQPHLWISAVIIHAAYWLGTFLARRSQVLPPWVLLVLPSPMYLLAAGGLSWLVLQSLSGVDGWLAGALLGVGWSIGVALSSRWAARTTANPLEFSAAANLTAILLFPLQQQEAQGGGQSAPVDWMATLLPLAAVASLVGLSFAVHRYRSSRHAAST